MSLVPTEQDTCPRCHKGKSIAIGIVSDQQEVAAREVDLTNPDSLVSGNEEATARATFYHVEGGVARPVWIGYDCGAKYSFEVVKKEPFTLRLRDRLEACPIPQGPAQTITASGVGRDSANQAVEIVRALRSVNDDVFSSAIISAIKERDETVRRLIVAQIPN